MYEIKEKRRMLPDGTELTTYTRDVVSANILEVEAGTTGFMGGDTGHGGRTYFRIQDEARTTGSATSSRTSVIPAMTIRKVPRPSTRRIGTIASIPTSMCAVRRTSISLWRALALSAWS